jgi:hypothetical protein
VFVRRKSVARGGRDVLEIFRVLAIRRRSSNIRPAIAVRANSSRWRRGNSTDATLEGGLDFKKNLTEALDGYAGIEHTMPIAPIYKDITTLLANSGTTWTPTLIVQYGGPWAENYWYENSDVVNDPKLNRFTPRDVVERKALRRPGWWAPSQWSFQLFAEQAAKLVAAGGRVGMGSHGQLQGLGAQWEIWNLASGGMPNYDVLRVATIFGAEAIGHEKDVGSLEAASSPDLQVLDKNPLEDIKNTNTIRYG